MLKTEAGDRAKALKKEVRELTRKAKKQKEEAAIMRKARSPVMRLQALADSRLAQALALKLEARLEDLQVWGQNWVKDTKKGAKTYTYWISSRREGGRIRNEYQDPPIRCAGSRTRRRPVL